MITNYFKIAWRSILRNKFFSIINIFGLATGLCSFLLISLYVIDELSYDKHFKDAERIFRINSDINFGGTKMKMSQSADPMGAVLKKDYHQVEQYTRIYTNEGQDFVKLGAEYIVENNIAYADSTFFEVFDIPVLEGNGKNALDKPNTVVISESLAKKYFNSTDVVGKTLSVGVESATLYTITAVFEDLPSNTHFHFDIILSMDNVNYGFGNFLSHNFNTYIKLSDGTDYKSFNKNFDQVIDRYILPQAQQFMEIKTMDDFRNSGNELKYSLFPMTDIHLKSDRSFEIEVRGNIQYVYIFGAVAFFLLFIACVNFMNLSTARSAGRAKEVGIRKVLGTERKSLLTQFFSESVLTSYLALLIALLIMVLILPLFNEVAAKSFSLSAFLNPLFMIILLALPLFTGTLAGFYPAIFLSSFRPIEVLKSKINPGLSKSNLRSVLVTSQFVISLTLIIGTIIVYQQLDFIKTKNIGYNKEQILILDGTSSLGFNQNAFKNEVLKMSGVQNGSQSNYLPVTNSSRSDNTFSKEAIMTETNALNMQVWKIDYDYIPVLGMEVEKGRNFSKEFGADSSAVIINETAAKMLGYKDPIGQYIYTSDGNSSNQIIKLAIVGIVKNFNFESLRENIGPLCFRLGNSNNTMIFKVSHGDLVHLVDQIEAKWNAFAPEMPFNYRFLDDSFDEMYRAETRIGKVVLIFAFLTILIACLGLFGLVTYLTEQRVKEIGIRKVLGANELNIVMLILKNFLKLVILAIVIASPIAYYFMNNWLQDFTYRISISWWVFVLAGLVAVTISLLTVSYQAIKAALMNPVKSLRSE